MKILSAAVALSASSLLALPWPWLSSPRQHTTAALEAWEAGDYQDAAAALEEALKLDPEDPRVRFNAGTGRLATGKSEEAAELLAQAARSSVDDLPPDAFYNLGNALLQAGHPAAALDAYKESLRRDPSHSAAKHNLELLLRQEAMGQSGSEDPQQSDGEGNGGTAPGRHPPTDPEADPGTERDSGADDSGGLPTPEEGAESSSRLPDFQAQEEMTAEQAASLLEAVEALEREQRRARAAEGPRQRELTPGWEKDW